MPSHQILAETVMGRPTGLEANSRTQLRMQQGYRGGGAIEEPPTVSVAAERGCSSGAAKLLRTQAA